jgi:hypothetical protein
LNWKTSGEICPPLAPSGALESDDGLFMRARELLLLAAC